MSWKSVAESTVSASNLYSFENTATAFLSHLLVHEEDSDGLLAGKHVLEATVSVADSKVEPFPGDQFDFLLESVVNLLYVGRSEFNEFSTVLEKVILAHEGKGLFELLNDINIIDQGGTSFLLSFSPTEEVSRELYVIPDHGDAKADHGLVAACIVLAICLLVVSGLLLWMAGGCAAIKSVLPWFRQEGVRKPYGRNNKREQSAERVETGSGILGAAASEDSENMPPGFTPTRGLYRDESDIMSPLSQITNITDASSRVVPLGITSMRKLNRFATPEKVHADKSAGNFQMTRLSYT